MALNGLKEIRAFPQSLNFMSNILIHQVLKLSAYMKCSLDEPKSDCIKLGLSFLLDFSQFYPECNIKNTLDHSRNYLKEFWFGLSAKDEHMIVIHKAGYERIYPVLFCFNKIAGTCFVFSLSHMSLSPNISTAKLPVKLQLS